MRPGGEDFIAAMAVGGLLVLEPVVTLVAAILFGGFYLVFMRMTRQRVQVINEVGKDESACRLVHQFIVGMREIKLRNAGAYFIDKINSISHQRERPSDQFVDRRSSA